MIIHIRNKHPDMQTIKLNAKYHLHVQHTTDTKTQRYMHRGYKIQQGYKCGVLKKIHNIN